MGGMDSEKDADGGGNYEAPSEEAEDRVKWLHPPPARVRAGPEGPTVELRAGEAAVFTLVRE